MQPLNAWDLHGLPCAVCGHPTRRMEIYPAGKRMVHIDERLRPCDVPYGQEKK